MTKTGIIVLIIIIALAGLVGFGVYQANYTPTPTIEIEVSPTPTPIETPTPTDIASSTPTTTPTSVAVKSFTVTGTNFSFTPKTLSVNKGDTVKITFKNQSGMHDFKIDEFNVSTQRIQGGSEETVTFVANKSGSFEYYCSVGEHRAMGMKGTLTVK